MTTSRLADEFGTDLSSRWRAAELRIRISVSPAGVEGPHVLDFADVRTVSDSFADELLGVLVEERGDAWFKQNVRLENLSPALRESLLNAILSRLDRV